MNRSQIAALFNRVYDGGRNFMTPNLVKYGKRGRLVYEISSGTGMRQQPIYGVTVLEIDGTERSDLSTMFQSLREAEAYIRRDFHSG